MNASWACSPLWRTRNEKEQASQSRLAQGGLYVQESESGHLSLCGPAAVGRGSGVLLL